VDIGNVILSRADLLSAPEQVRAEKFKFARDRDLFVTAHVALRSILARYLAESNNESLSWMIHRRAGVEQLT
jgi:hypothetical protein